MRTAAEIQSNLLTPPGCISPLCTEPLLNRAQPRLGSPRPLAEMVVQADVGTQSIADAYRHAMCAARTSPADCERKYNEFVESELKKCTKEGLANAIHAVQDSFSDSHRGMQWYGGTLALMVPFLGLDHIISDATPGRTEQYEVPRKTADMIRNWQKQCGCSGK